MQNAIDDGSAPVEMDDEYDACRPELSIELCRAPQVAPITVK